MELILKNILFGIKLSDSLLYRNKFQITPAFSYYKTLNIILNKFSLKGNLIENKRMNFKDLQLVIEE